MVKHWMRGLRIGWLKAAADNKPRGLSAPYVYKNALCMGCYNLYLKDFTSESFYKTEAPNVCLKSKV